jgi:tripartite-type tricarboxylate transporter receptor subunit TctC
VLVTHPSFPVRTVIELIALAKARPRAINYASSGNGSSNHLAAELFNQLAQVRLEHVPYKGSAPAVVALVAGEVPVGFPALPAAIAQINGGRIRALALASRKRAQSMPDLVTMTEAGVPGCEVEAWHGIMAPAGTPAAVITRLSTAIQAALRDRDVIARYDAVGFEPGGGSPEDFARFISSEMKKWAKVIKSANITPD